MATKTKKKPKASKNDKYASQVSAESTLKFGPEEGSLAQALSDADSGYSSDVAVAKGSASALRQAARKAKPEFAKDYGTALGTVNEASGSLASDLAKLPSAGALGGAVARDSAGARTRLAEALASSQAEETSREQDAVSGQKYAIDAAGARRDAAKDKVTARVLGLAQEKGAFAQSRAGELGEAAADRSVTRRQQNLTDENADLDRGVRSDELSEQERHNKAQEEKEKKDAAHKGRATPAQTQKTKTQITRALDVAKRIMAEGGGRKRSDAAKILVNGREDMTIKNAPKDGKYGGQDYKAGDPLINPIKIPGAKATEELIASVALDVAYDGHISTRNMKLLQKQGLSVRELGLPTKGRSGTAGAAKPPATAPVVKKPVATVNPLTGQPLLGGFGG